MKRIEKKNPFNPLTDLRVGMVCASTSVSSGGRR
jgi:hypothetical protein